MKLLRLATLGLSLLLAQSLSAQSSPIPALESSANKILATLKEHRSELKKNHQIIFHSIEQNLLPNVDVSGMSRSVLGRQVWSKASPAERAEFTKAFTQLVIRTYATPLAEYTDETIRFAPIRGSLDSRFIRVNSTIVRSKGNNIPLSYSLVSKNGQWKIYDFSVEGVSLLQSFRSQFAQALQNSNINAIIKQMHDNAKKAA